MFERYGYRQITALLCLDRQSVPNKQSLKHVPKTLERITFS